MNIGKTVNPFHHPQVSFEILFFDFLLFTSILSQFHILVIKRAYKDGFRWREVAFPVQGTFDAPPGFQLSSFHGDRPIYKTETVNTVPTGVVSNSDPDQPQYLPDWAPPKTIVWETPTGASPFGVAPVPELQPIPKFVHRPEIASTRRSISSKPSVDVPTTSVAGPSRILQARIPTGRISTSTRSITSFRPRGVPGSDRTDVNLVSLHFDVNNNYYSSDFLIFSQVVLVWGSQRRLIIRRSRVRNRTIPCLFLCLSSHSISAVEMKELIP